MDQRGRMQQLNQRCAAMCRFIDTTANACRKKNEHRPDLLSLALNNIMGNTVEERYRALHGSLKLTLKNINISRDRFFDLVDAQHGDNKLIVSARLIQVNSQQT